MKKCFKCENEKLIDDFYKHPAMGDGHLNKCKECTKKDVREDRKNKFEQYSEYEKNRYQSNENRRLKMRKSAKKWREENPLGYKAQTAVGYAIRSGKLTKKDCLFCGAQENIHAHHNDYKRPLDVVWLCAKCHTRMHANFPDHHGHGDVA